MTIQLKPRNRVADVAKYWDCSPGKVYKLIKSGQLGCIRMGDLLRVRDQDIMEYEGKCLDHGSPHQSSNSEKTEEPESGRFTGQEEMELAVIHASQKARMKQSVTSIGTCKPIPAPPQLEIVRQ